MSTLLHHALICLFTYFHISIVSASKKQKIEESEYLDSRRQNIVEFKKDAPLTLSSTIWILQVTDAGPCQDRGLTWRIPPWFQLNINCTNISDWSRSATHQFQVTQLSRKFRSTDWRRNNEHLFAGYGLTVHPNISKILDNHKSPH